MTAIFTIGYGGRSPDGFVSLLRQYGIGTVVDVRIRPDRSSMGAFRLARTPDKGIQRLLHDAGIAYRSVPGLGNPFKDDADWMASYDRFLREDGCARLALLDGIAGRFCLLCAEKDPERCHRKQIATALEERGWNVSHITS
jgi:uncharacterized protein (DUF488 family)